MKTREVLWLIIHLIAFASAVFWCVAIAQAGELPRGFRILLTMAAFANVVVVYRAAEAA